MDMKEKVFSRDDVQTFVDGFRLLQIAPADMPREWTMHVGPGSVAKLVFQGPIGADEWDALLAHIAFYKQWYKEKPTTPLLNLKDAVDEIFKKLDAAGSEVVPNGDEK